jgi:hypothetical protein
VFTVWTTWLLASIGGLIYVPPPVDPVFAQRYYPLLLLLEVQTAFYVTIDTINTCFVSLRIAQRNPDVWLCLIPVFIALSATSAMGPARGGSAPHFLLAHHVGQYNVVYGQVPLINHWFGEFGRLLRLGASQIGSLVYHNTVETARQTLVCHLQHCIPALIESTHNHRVLGDTSNGTHQRRKKRGRKSNNRKEPIEVGRHCPNNE